MCLIVKGKQKIANKDIICYKLCVKDNDQFFHIFMILSMN